MGLGRNRALVTYAEDATHAAAEYVLYAATAETTDAPYAAADAANTAANATDTK